MFVLNSRITVGGFTWSGVESGTVERSLHSAADSCTIRMPTVGRVKYKNGSAPQLETIGDLFKENDKVKVELGYNGDLKTEFQGFVNYINPGGGRMPTEIVCEGYIRPLRLNKNLKGFYAQTSVKQLLQLAVKGTGIKLVVQDDIQLYNITLDNAGGTDVIREIMNICQRVITIFFVTPDTLWCGLTYTAYKEGRNPFGVGEVKYRIGYNCLRDNSLTIKRPAEPIQVILGGTLATGRRVETASEKKVLSNRATAMSNNLHSIAEMQKIANEMQYQKNYTGFEGSVTAFLQPYCQPGYKMWLEDSRYPDSKGYYIAESVRVNFSPAGGRRIVEVGPQIGFKD